MSNLEDLFGPPVSVYTRDQALADGVLVDVTAIAKPAGFRIPVTLTAAAYGVCQDEQGEDEGDTRQLTALLRDAAALVRGALAARGDHAADEPIPMLWQDGQGRPRSYWIVFDTHEGFVIGEPEDF